MVVVLEEGGRSRDVDEEEENGGWGYLSSKKQNKTKKNKRSKEKKQNKIKQTDWSQPRMRLDLPPGGFLRPPEAALAPPDGAEGSGISFCC